MSDVDQLIVRAKLFPMSVTKQDIVNFFGVCTVSNGMKGVHIIINDSFVGNTIDAFVKFSTIYGYKTALNSKWVFKGGRSIIGMVIFFYFEED